MQELDKGFWVCFRKMRDGGSEGMFLLWNAQLRVKVVVLAHELQKVLILARESDNKSPHKNTAYHHTAIWILLLPPTLPLLTLPLLTLPLLTLPSASSLSVLPPLPPLCSPTSPPLPPLCPPPSPPLPPLCPPPSLPHTPSPWGVWTKPWRH